MSRPKPAGWKAARELLDNWHITAEDKAMRLFIGGWRCELSSRGIGTLRHPAVAWRVTPYGQIYNMMLKLEYGQ